MLSGCCRNQCPDVAEIRKSADSDVWIVTCADKFHNVSMMLTDYKLIGNKLWERFNRGKEVVFHRTTKSIGSRQSLLPASLPAAAGNSE
jgi:hypothetical protein